MSNNFKYVQTQPFTLGPAGQSIGDVSIILTSFLDIEGVALAMTDFGTIGFGTLEPSSGTNEEQISFSGVTQNGNGTATLTGIKTVLFKSPYTQTSGLAKSHAGGVKFVISNTAGFYNELVSVDDDETINGLYTFTQFPITPSSAPISNYQVANKKYVDDTVTSGAANATTSVKGIVQLPTQAQVDAKTATGSTGASLTPTPANLRATQYNDYVADTGSASTYVIAPSPVITAYATGQQFTFIAATANSANAGVSTIAVNGLAQKTIKKFLSTDLAINDIKVGQVITVVYDGTNFQMIQPGGNGYVDLATAQTVAGVKTFSSIPASGGSPSGSTDLTTKAYVDAKFATTLVHSGSGTSASTSAGDLDTASITGLTALDTLVIYYAISTITQNGTACLLRSGTDTLITIGNNVTITSGNGVGGTTVLRQDQSATTTLWCTDTTSAASKSTGNSTNAAGAVAVTSPSVGTAWTGSWTLALRSSGGVTSGGTLRYSWSVFKVAGQ